MNDGRSCGDCRFWVGRCTKNKVISTDWHQTKAEFIRQAVREKLTKLGIKPPKLDEEASQ